MSAGRQVGVAIEDRGDAFDYGFRVDLIGEGSVIGEMKSGERVTPAHKNLPPSGVARAVGALARLEALAGRLRAG